MKQGRPVRAAGREEYVQSRRAAHEGANSSPEGIVVMKPAVISRRRVRRNGSAVGRASRVPAANGHAATAAVVTSNPRLVPARAGDHAAIHHLLLSQFRGPSPLEFQAQLDEPLYEPTDRLLVKHR